MASATWLPRHREEERRDEFADCLARGFKRAFDLDRHPHLRGNAKLPPARDHRGAPAKENLSPGLPHTPPTPTSGTRSRYLPAPPQEEASREARSGNKPSTTGKAPASESFRPDDDTDMPSLPPTPPYLKAPLPPSSPPARPQ
ncbi:hypothetical protein N7465_001574 [Penicillium sp. CMV-2018d]|nr:hypothetical protein N7465_001574 [Penicillium sp. CMV-2018d]